MNHFVPTAGLSAFLFATNLVWPPVRWALLVVLCFAPCPTAWKPLRFKIAAFCDAMGKWSILDVFYFFFLLFIYSVGFIPRT